MDQVNRSTRGFTGSSAVALLLVAWSVGGWEITSSVTRPYKTTVAADK